MKNIIEILKGLGIEVPEEKTSDLNKEVSENYKTIAEFDKKVEKLETERDNLKERAETAEGTLKDFEGKDFEAITKERDEWKVKYEDKLRTDEEAKEAAEFNEAIANAIKEAKGKNEKAIIANLDIETLKASKNRDKDIADALKALSDGDETRFLFATDPEEKRAHFTDTMKTGNGSTRITKADIMKVKDTTERQKLISENKDLFGLAE